MTRGEEWAAKVREAYTLNEAEELTVDLIAETIDQLDELPTSAVVERRQQRTLLLRALSQLALPDADGSITPPLTASQRGRKAARARWDAAQAGGGR